jgi:1-acyl-sn-glycerol-3-phosphate acyltransferase
MRSLFVGLVALIMTVVLGPVVIVAGLFRVPQGPESIYARCVRRWAKSVNWAAGVRVRVHGQLAPSGQGAVYVANHVSWFDIFALAAEVPWCSFIAKSELRKIPIFGFAAQVVGIVFLDRDNRKAAFESYEKAAGAVQRGRSIIVCPEGTRGYDYHLRPFKKGPFVFAIASQAPLIPAIVHGAREVMPKGTFRIRPGVVDLHFLEPIPTAGLDYDARAELTTTVWSVMADALRRLYSVTSVERPIAAAGERQE